MLETVKQMSFTSNLRAMIELKYTTFAESLKKTKERHLNFV